MILSIMDRRFSLRLKLHKVPGSMVQHQALLHKHLEKVHGLKCKFVQGYAISPVDKMACWHCWIEDSHGVEYDVTQHMVGQILRSDSVPEGYTRAEFQDDQGKIILDENQRLYDLFVTNPKKFWEEAPPKVKSFKV